MNVKYVGLRRVSQVAITWLTSALTISSGTLCTMETVAVEMGLCWLPFVLCNLGGRKRVGVLHFLVRWVLADNLIEKKVTLKNMSADVTDAIMYKD